MNNIATLSLENRKFIFESTAIKLKMHPAILEKLKELENILNKK